MMGRFGHLTDHFRESVLIVLLEYFTEGCSCVKLRPKHLRLSSFYRYNSQVMCKCNDDVTQELCHVL